MKNRSDVEIMASILSSAYPNWEYKTTIMNTSMISHSQLVRYLAIAVEKGLVEYSELTGLYRTTQVGLVYLDKYRQLLRLLPAIPDLPDLIIHSKGEEKREDEQQQERLQQKNPIANF